jgi:signal-transduction protein with cAMP-binding, CBS, and nucleotidyltransferase domain
MSFDDLLVPLSRVPLLAGLQLAQLSEMARRGEKLRYSPGDSLIKAGQAGDGAYLILAGTVDCIAGGNAAPGERIAVGSLIGEMAMFVEDAFSATHVARDRVLCLKLTRAGMHAQMLEDPALIEHFQRRIAERTRRLSEELRQLDNASAAAKTAQHVQASKPHQAAAEPPQRFVAAPRAWR